MSLNTQNKLIVLGSLISSIFVVITAWIVIDNTQRTILESYHNFGSMLAKTLAVEGIDMISDFNENPQKSAEIRKNNYNKLKTYSRLAVKSNKDISYIVFKDVQGNILYSTKNNRNVASKNSLSTIEVSQPIIDEKNNSSRVIGSVQLGLTGNTINIVGKATRNLMIIVFTIAWILSIAAVLINTLLITRQITLLVAGVRKVSTGEFGYKLCSKDLWGEIKELFEAFNDMSSRLRKYEEKNIDQLTYEKNKLEAVLMSIANGVVVCDNFDKIVLVNNAAIKMLNVTAKDLISTRILDYGDSRNELCFRKELLRFREIPFEHIESRPLEFQVTVNSRTIKAFTSPIFTINQEYIGYILILHDITREAEIDRIKNTFISNVSHELRTPVTILKSYIDTLFNYGHEFDDKTKQEFMMTINHETDRLNKLVNDILDFSRLESANVELERTLTDVGEIIENTVKSMKILAKDKKLLFSIIIEPNLPKIMLNSESIDRALKNLLSNAIKYSNENGKIEIRAEIDESGNYLQVLVEDNGIGIPDEHLGKIFNRFYRVENTAHTIKGTGLGLHLVKITIEKHHGGQVFVASKVNEGSTFGFKIPLQAQKSDSQLV